MEEEGECEEAGGRRKRRGIWVDLKSFKEVSGFLEVIVCFGALPKPRCRVLGEGDPFHEGHGIALWKS